MSDREGYLKRRDQLLMQDERIAELKMRIAELEKAARAVIKSHEVYQARNVVGAIPLDRLRHTLEDSE